MIHMDAEVFYDYAEFLMVCLDTFASPSSKIQEPRGSSRRKSLFDESRVRHKSERRHVAKRQQSVPAQRAPRRLGDIDCGDVLAAVMVAENQRFSVSGQSIRSSPW